MPPSCSIAAVGRLLNDSFPRTIVGHQLFQASGIPASNIRDAYGRCRSGPRWKAPNRSSSRGTKTDDVHPRRRELVLFLILLQPRDAKAPGVFVGIFTAIIPAPLERAMRYARTNSIDSTTGSLSSRSCLAIPYSVSMPKRRIVELDARLNDLITRSALPSAALAGKTKSP